LATFKVALELQRFKGMGRSPFKIFQAWGEVKEKEIEAKTFFPHPKTY
jgi:hypothetical protein